MTDPSASATRPRTQATGDQEGTSDLAGEGEGVTEECPGPVEITATAGELAQPAEHDRLFAPFPQLSGHFQGIAEVVLGLRIVASGQCRLAEQSQHLGHEGAVA